MTQIGVVRNPKSGRNRNRASDNAAVLANKGVLLAEPHSEAELADTLAYFARREVGILVIDGGDGTVREALTALPLAYGANLPSLSILSSGKTNLIARDVGSFGFGRRALDSVIEAARGERLTKICERPVLEVHWLDATRPPLRGMFFGAAAFVLGTESAEKLHRRGFVQGPAVAAAVASAFFRALGNKSGERWRAGQHISIKADAGAARDGSRFLFLATTLHRLMLGLWPFWGDGSRPIRYVDVPAGRMPLLAFALPLLLGRPTSRMLDRGFRSGTADALAMNFSAQFVLDGEKFHSGDKGILLSAGPHLRFLSP